MVENINTFFWMLFIYWIPSSLCKQAKDFIQTFYKNEIHVDIPFKTNNENFYYLLPQIFNKNFIFEVCNGWYAQFLKHS